MTAPSSDVNFDLLIVGLSKDNLNEFTIDYSEINIKFITNEDDFDDLLENYQLKTSTSVIVSTKTKGLSHLEVVQALSSTYTGIEIFFVTDNRDFFNLEDLHKNGFSQSFLFPLDITYLRDIFDQIRMQKTGGIFKKYKRVNMFDIKIGDHLPFQLFTYLPINKKYILLTASGYLTSEKFDKLKVKNKGDLYVLSQEVESFYEYTAQSLIAGESFNNNAVSFTEKTDQIRTYVRDLFHSIFDIGDKANFEHGKVLGEQAHKIIAHYLDLKVGSNVLEMYKQVMASENDLYSHSQNVSTLACMLSLATGIGAPEDLAIAGLFHDIGQIELPPHMNHLNMEKWDLDTQAQYVQHGKRSVNILKEKKMTLTPKVIEIIEKHHEREDGRGFPLGLVSHKIPIEAHLLKYADTYDYLMQDQNQKITNFKKFHEEVCALAVLNKDLVSCLNDLFFPKKIEIEAKESA